MRSDEVVITVEPAYAGAEFSKVLLWSKEISAGLGRSVHMKFNGVLVTVNAATTNEKAWMEYDWELREKQKERKAINEAAEDTREQRRYEIARDCAAAIAGNNYEREAAVCIADYAISIANALLAKLDKEPQPCADQD